MQGEFIVGIKTGEHTTRWQMRNKTERILLVSDSDAVREYNGMGAFNLSLVEK